MNRLLIAALVTLLGCTPTTAAVVPATVIGIENILKSGCKLAEEQPEPEFLIYICEFIDGTGGGTKAEVKTFKVRVPRPPASLAAASSASAKK